MNVGQNTQTVSVDARSMCEYHVFLSKLIHETAVDVRACVRCFVLSFLGD